MNSDPTSLNRLHDIILPSAVSWWPLAPGWYLLIFLLLVVIAFFCYRFWKMRQANAYRRAALQELANKNDASSIAELLRRTALAVVPRSEIAEKTGSSWADWLAGQCPDPMPLEVQQLLAAGVYSASKKDQDVRLLRAYASHWISNHHMISQSITE